MKNKPDAFICLWEYVPKKTIVDHRQRWRLVECYGVDDSGYAVTPNIHASNDRYSYMQFMNRKCWYDPKKKKEVFEIPEGVDPSDHQWSPIMGRAVTTWDMASGVTLAELHPPEWVEWLSIQFVSELKKLSNWHVFIEKGYDLYLGTVKAVKDTMSLIELKNDIKNS